MSSEPRKKKPRKEMDMSPCARFAPETSRDRKRRRGRMGLRPRAWRTTNAASSAPVTRARTSVRVETRPWSEVCTIV